MIIRALKDYRDKETKEICLKGSFREVSDERGNELVAKELAIEYVPNASKEEIPDGLVDEEDISSTDTPVKETKGKNK